MKRSSLINRAPPSPETRFLVSWEAHGPQGVRCCRAGRSLVLGRDTLGPRPSNTKRTVPLRDLHDLVHGTADARVVDHDDGLGLCGDGRLDEALVDIERIGPDIHENRHGTAQRPRHSRSRTKVEGTA